MNTPTAISVKEPTIEIPLSKAKVVRALFISVVLVALGLWLVIARPQTGNPVLGNPVLIVVVGLASMLFFGMGIIVLIRKLNDKRPGLVITGEGIMDNASGVAAGVIPWSEIEEIKVARVMSQQFLMLIVKHPQQYIQRQTNAIKRKGMELNYKNYGSPVSISAASLKIGFKELETLLRENWEKNKTHASKQEPDTSRSYKNEKEQNNNDLIFMSLGMPRHGWLPVFFRAKDFQIEFDASDVLNNPVEELYKAAFRLGESGSQVVAWWLEPAAYLFEFEREGDVITLRIMEKSHLHGDESIKKLLHSVTGSDMEILGPVRTALKEFLPLKHEETDWRYFFDGT